MFTQSNVPELASAGLDSEAYRELDLAITMIQNLSVRSPPYSGFGSKINPVLSTVFAGGVTAETPVR